MPTFTPPTVPIVPARSPQPFARTKYNTGQTVMKTGGYYTTTLTPTNEQIAAADVTYLGGRTYTITTTEADALTAAGFGSGIA